MLRRHLSLLASLLALPSLAGDTARDPAAAILASWPQWRGPLANGVAPNANPPLHWSETNHIRWKLPLAGKGHSTPVIFGDRIFLTAAVDRKSVV